MKLLHTCTAFAAVALAPFAAAAAADTTTLPSMYAPVSIAPATRTASQVQAGARVGAHGKSKGSALDGTDTTTDLILIGAAGALGYFAHDIFNDNDHNGSSPN